MSDKLQPVRGTQDHLPETYKLLRGIDDVALQTSQLFGFEPIATPIFEFSQVFHRSLGDSSDIISKETYTFTDRGGEELTLRPEGTAGLARAFVSNGLAQNLPLKFYYSGPMFRYERPQKGRLRQFHQIGVESLGYETPWADVESIALGFEILKKLGVANKVTLQLNSLGDPESRQKHRDNFVKYLTPLASKLSADSQVRLAKNPLRIFDSKDEGDQKIVKDAPTVQDSLNDVSRKFFDTVLDGLTKLGIPFEVAPQLVRGLDYYTHTVFEFTTTHLGAQNAVLAGGRYDGLIAMMGGPATAGVGWGAGMERLSLLLEPDVFNSKQTLIAVLAAEESCEADCFAIANSLRSRGLKAEFLEAGNVGKRMKKAHKMGADFVLLMGGAEKSQNVVALKNMTSGEQKNIPLAELKNYRFV